MSKAIQEQKSIIFWLKLDDSINALNTAFIKNQNLKVVLREIIKFEKDKISQLNKECNRAYKQLDEIDEQLDEKQRKLKNNLGEMIKNVNLFLKIS